ncbi:phage tail tape measure protein [Cohaesibacter celericrescens]|uniref:Tail tape measure protein n=1 Tax=Cohaesibacter celericrescens TaxID=2067669 RepID=A0A2N5XQK5_9HYPH|nr:hypothetical protein [Cohaesibacter celericrescens]PLW76801.1 hypothetical protein C0081_12120 [Cohaesibacter celericrescens]
MADNKLEKLVLTMEARTAQFDKALKKIERNTSTSFTRSSKSVNKFSGQMKQSAVVARGLATSIAGFAGVAVGAGIVGLGKMAQSAAADIASMSAEAKRAGLSFEAFQELQFAAQKSGVSVDALTDGIKELQLRADEFIVTGKGSAAEAFARLGFDAETLKEALKKPDQLFQTIIGRLGELDKAAQIRVADEIFGGTGGEQFVQMISMGEKGLEDARKEARKLGLVLEEDVAKQAAQINREFNTLSTVVGVKLKGAIVEATAALLQFRNSFDDTIIGDSAGGQIDTVFRLADEYREAQAALERAQETLVGFRAQGSPVGVTGNAAAEVKKQLAEVKKYSELIAKADHDLGGGAIAVSGLDIKDVQKRLGLVSDKPTLKPPKIKPDDDEKDEDKPSKGLTQRANKVREVVLALELEAQQLGRTSDQQELYNALSQAGVSLEGEQGQAIASAVTGLQAKRLAIQDAMIAEEALQQRTEQVAQSFEYLGQSGLDMLTSIVTGSMSAEDAMKQMALQIANAAAQAMLFGQGPLGGLFSSMGGSANGVLGGLFSSLAGSLTGLGASAVNLGPGQLYSSGGYTGDGPKNKPAGVVHKGEVVWSQRDIARAGGAAVVEAMRLGKRGYASGGIVGKDLFNPKIAGRIEPRKMPAIASTPDAANSGPAIIMNISTPDASSFQRSQSQISASLAQAVSRGRRNG